ncbi:uncharacterized protein LOC143876536 isoform X2 [Tasmannia lanceolata]|uniref:uncharacterized protein LOC143876536 isoform X2 n=1 Tax=Tasmannia lanceolata TaxID=3420 RepID=UPI0040639DA1
MASSSCNRLMNRTALSSLKSPIRSKLRTSSPNPPSAGKSSSAIPRRFSSITRSPSELGCVHSLLPLHSAVAIARLTSCLSLNSRDSRALSQDGNDGSDGS